MYALANPSIRMRLTAAFGLLAALLIAVSATGLSGMDRSNSDMTGIYEDRLVPVSLLARINNLMRQNVQEMMVATVARASAENTGKYLARVEGNVKAIDDLVMRYLASNMTMGERELADAWAERRGEFLNKGLKPVIAALREGDFSDAEDILLGVAAPRYYKVQEAMDALVAKQLEIAEGVREDAETRFSATLGMMITAALIALGTAAAFGLLTVRAVVHPLVRLGRVVAELGAGNTWVPVSDIDRKDEIGPLARALEQWRIRLIEAAERHEQERNEIARREARQKRVDDATQRFDATVIAMLGKIKAAVGYLHTSANTLSANAEQTQRQSAAVSSATEQATANVETVSAAGTELMASIQEISRQVQQSATTAQAASTEAEATNRKIGGLADAAHKIGEVVRMINDIASQTNLLALNATIESARAGDAGKGFAVVAHEVKNLAGQTGRATEDIAAQISSVQAETQAAVKAIEGISQTIDRINEMATAIAGAVEEQGAATAEIARNVEQASIGTREVATNIAGVAQAAAETGRMSQSVFQAANGLLAESETLEREVERFLSEVRAA